MVSATHLETLALHAGYEPDPTTGSRVVPVHRTVLGDLDHALGQT